MASATPSTSAIPSSSPPLPPNQTTGAGLPPPLPATPSSVAAITPPVGTQNRDTSDANGHVYIAPTSLSPQLNSGAPIDARVRNPVPSKLKGRIDGRNGNFSVMHMDLIRPDMTERDLAAKRSSEGTEAAARLANKEGYRPVKRTRWVPPDSQLYPSHPTLSPGLPRHPNTLVSPPLIPPLASPLATSTALPATTQNAPITTHSAPVSIPATGSILPLPDVFHSTNSPPNSAPSNPAVEPEATTTPVPHPPARLTSAEIKSEQIRLLHLLRSLNPSRVVDQLCTALTFFGGTPGVPAPADGQFPDSIHDNGSGSLFVSWVAEIFPHGGISPSSELNKTTTPVPITAMDGGTPTTSANALSGPVKRGRGRPKGSTKKNKEKEFGIAAQGIDGSTIPQSMPVGAAMDASRLNINNSNGSQPQFPASDIAQAALIEQNSDGSMLNTPGPRKRGRPKGSKNKPKSKPTDNDGMMDLANAGGLHQSQNPMVDSPLAHKTSTQTGPYCAANEVGIDTDLHITAPHVLQEDYSDHTQIREHSNGLTQDTQLSNIGNQSNTATPRASSWKRQNSRHSQLGSQDAPETNDILQTPGSAQNHTTPAQVQQAKRRRVPREANQNLGSSNMESQLSGPGMLASSLLGPDGQPLSPAKQLRHGIGLIIQEEIHRQHHRPSDMEQQSPNPAHGPSPGMQRSQSSRAQGRPQATMSAQGFFQPQSRQMPNQYGHGGNTSERFGRNMSSNQFQHHMMNSSSHLGGQPPPPQSQQQQQQPARPSHSMGPFQGYTDQPYLDIDYSNTPASFGGHTQLEAALAEPNVGDRLFHTMGRR